MEFLKDLFPEGKALTYEELPKAAKDKGFEVVNTAGGAYVPKASVETLTGQLNEANTKRKGCVTAGIKTKTKQVRFSHWETDLFFSWGGV